MRKVKDYRFKTKEEFIKEYGSEEEFISRVDWIHPMNDFFGRPLSDFVIIDEENFQKGCTFEIREKDKSYTYFIRFNMLVEIEPKKSQKALTTVWIDQTSDKRIFIAYAVSGYDTEVVITYEGKAFKGRAHRRKNEPNIPAVGFSLALARAADKAIKVLGQIPMFYRIDTGEVR